MFSRPKLSQQSRFLLIASVSAMVLMGFNASRVHAQTAEAAPQATASQHSAESQAYRELWREQYEQIAGVEVADASGTVTTVDAAPSANAIPVPAPTNVSAMGPHLRVKPIGDNVFNISIRNDNDSNRPAEQRHVLLRNAGYVLAQNLCGKLMTTVGSVALQNEGSGPNASVTATIVCKTPKVAGEGDAV